jgi:hypothetical protein
VLQERSRRATCENRPVISRETFERIKKRYGEYASWAVWATASPGKPKSNMGDIRVLDPDTNPGLLETLRNDVVMVGLNISRPVSEPFRNFHDPSSSANDFKIRFAFEGTSYYGAYMTDFIKGVEIVKSADLLRHLEKHPFLEQENTETFVAELTELGCRNPMILAFGAEAHRLVQKNLPRVHYSRLVKLMHYSNYVGTENYKQAVLAAIAGQQ